MMLYDKVLKILRQAGQGLRYKEIRALLGYTKDENYKLTRVLHHLQQYGEIQVGVRMEDGKVVKRYYLNPAPHENEAKIRLRLADGRTFIDQPLSDLDEDSRDFYLAGMMYKDRAVLVRVEMELALAEIRQILWEMRFSQFSSSLTSTFDPMEVISDPWSSILWRAIWPFSSQKEWELKMRIIAVADTPRSVQEDLGEGLAEALIGLAEVSGPVRTYLNDCEARYARVDNDLRQLMDELKNEIQEGAKPFKEIIDMVRRGGRGVFPDEYATHHSRPERDMR